MTEVLWVDGDDRAFQVATERARQTFRYFWREMFWETKRIVPAWSLGIVKLAFPTDPDAQDAPHYEHMWIDEVTFDGRVVRGNLVNEPNWVAGLTEGDTVAAPVDEITDWLYAGDRVYGGFTIHAMRASMAPDERREHDSAWGFDFGDPLVPQVVPAHLYEPSKPGAMARLFGSKKRTEPLAADELDQEHPLSEVMEPSLDAFLRQQPEEVVSTDPNGLTMLHQLALAGSLAGVRLLLRHGADITATTPNGDDALALAEAMGWSRVVQVLREQSRH